MTDEQIAEVCHEVNRAYCHALGDDSHASWDVSPAWMKDSVLQGVAAHRSNPELSPAASHEAWFQSKTADGWQWGEENDPLAKTHPSLMAFELLPTEIRAKDHIFKAICDALA